MEQVGFDKDRIGYWFHVVWVKGGYWCVTVGTVRYDTSLSSCMRAHKSSRRSQKPRCTLTIFVCSPFGNWKFEYIVTWKFFCKKFVLWTELSLNLKNVLCLTFIIFYEFMSSYSLLPDNSYVRPIFKVSRILWVKIGKTLFLTDTILDKTYS